MYFVDTCHSNNAGACVLPQGPRPFIRRNVASLSNVGGVMNNTHSEGGKDKGKALKNIFLILKLFAASALLGVFSKHVPNDAICTNHCHWWMMELISDVGCGVCCRRKEGTSENFCCAGNSLSTVAVHIVLF